MVGIVMSKTLPFLGAFSKRLQLRCSLFEPLRKLQKWQPQEMASGSISMRRKKVHFSPKIFFVIHGGRPRYWRRVIPIFSRSRNNYWDDSCIELARHFYWAASAPRIENCSVESRHPTSEVNPWSMTSDQLLKAFLAFMANAVLVQADAHSMQCQSTKLVVYKVTFSTFWNREKFPKQYPEFRPPAQWTKLVGKIQKKARSCWLGDRVSGSVSSIYCLIVVVPC